MEPKTYPANLLFPLGPKFMALARQGNKRGIWEKRLFLAIPSYLTSSWSVVSSFFCWGEVRVEIEKEEEEARGHTTLMAQRLSRGGVNGMKENKTWRISGDSSTILTSWITKAWPSCQDTREPEMQLVGGDDSKEAGKSDTKASTKNYTLWEHHKLPETGYWREGVGVECEILNQEAHTLFPALSSIYGRTTSKRWMSEMWLHQLPMWWADVCEMLWNL